MARNHHQEQPRVGMALEQPRVGMAQKQPRVGMASTMMIGETQSVTLILSATTMKVLGHAKPIFGTP